MNNEKQVERIVSILLFMGLFFNLFFVYFAQERLYNYLTFGNNSLGPERFLRIFSVVAVFLTVFISIFLARSKYHFSVFFAYLLLLAYISLNFMVSGGDITNMTEFMDKKGIGTWVCLGLLFVSYNDNRYAFFKKFLLIATLFISILTIYSFIDFGVGLWRGQALAKYRVYAVNMIWIVPYLFLTLKTIKKLQWLRVFILVMGVILALVIQTRSFLIIYFITLIFDFYHSKDKTNYFVLLGLGIVGITFLIINTDMLSTSLELLMNRGTDDTRTEQIQVFLSQLNFWEIITGGGLNVSYMAGYEEVFAIDNQWLYLLWWGGLIPVLCYFYLTGILPIKMVLRKNLSYETKVECFVLILWLLALLGLAIYTTMTIDLFFFIVTIILGRVLYKLSNNLS
ncbi:hypothetical protein [Flagellimonas beolgyonensis]|uniref:hypothetical protein n=1 Tax=Flagellimonas beolgyonensis TaxID=864064 RepID=UPI003D649592